MMAIRTAIGLSITLLWGICVAEAGAADPRVEIEIFQSGRVSPSVPQEWLRVLSEVGFANPRIRNARSGDQIGISTGGSETLPVYKVVGRLGNNGRIQLSATEAFGRNERQQLKAWIKDLKDHGPQGAAEKVAFDLTSEQFALVQKDLSTIVRNGTKGKPTSKAIEELSADLTYPLRFDSASQKILRGGGEVRDELQGMATGTALAAILRPLGLVFRPQEKKSGKFEFVVAKTDADSESWPVGWKPAKKDADTIPNLFKFLRTQEVEMLASDALSELANQIGAPMIWDYRAMAARKIDLTSAKIKMRSERRHLKAVLRRIVRQVDLAFDVREDDAGQAFLWMRPSR